jgi:hypothetical protein
MKNVRFVLEPEIIGEPRKPKSGMWAATKRDSDPTAKQSLEAIILRTHKLDSNKRTKSFERTKSALTKSLEGLRANTLDSDERTKSFERTKLALSKSFEGFSMKSSAGGLKNWIWSFSEYLFPPQKRQILTSFTAPAGHAARIEHEWAEAVKRAHAKQAFHEQMVKSSSSALQLSGSSLTISQNDLASARERHDHDTRSFVSSAAGHRHPTCPEAAKRAKQAEPTGAAGPAGSIWSNEPVSFLPPQVPASQIITPGLRQLTPTPPCPTTFDAESANATDHESGDASPKPSRNSSVTAIDTLMKGDGDGMVSFGRWRHHKDAPLSLVKDMIDRDLRDSGRCAPYGPGGLNVFDHSLVDYYNNRLQEIQQGETYEESPVPHLSPITADHCRLQCQLLISPTPVTFSMDMRGMFTATGFYTRTASMSSTIESASPTDDVYYGACEQKHGRRDSGAGQSLTIITYGSKRVNGRPGQVLRPYDPDPGLNIIGINNQNIPPYRRNLVAYVSEKYRIDFCGGAPKVARTRSAGENTQHPTTFTDTPQPEVPLQIEHHEHAQQRGDPPQRGYAMQRTGHHVQLANYYQQAERAVPQTRGGPDAAGQQGRQVNPRRLPGPNARQITLVSAEDADDAMWSDDESVDEDSPESPFARRAIVLPPSTSKISKMVSERVAGRVAGRAAERTSQSTATVQLHEDVGRASAPRSEHSSIDNTPTNANAGLNTSTGPTPSHITPGTTASSGNLTITSPAHAQSIPRKLSDLLKNALAEQNEPPQISF